MLSQLTQDEPIPRLPFNNSADPLSLIRSQQAELEKMDSDEEENQPLSNFARNKTAKQTLALLLSPECYLRAISILYKYNI